MWQQVLQLMMTIKSKLALTQIHKHNVTFNKTVAKLGAILIKWIFPYVNPRSYLNSFLESLQKWQNFWTVLKWTITEKIETMGEAELGIEHEIFRGIEERSSENSRGQLKKVELLGVLKKRSCVFLWVLVFYLVISKRCYTILWNFQWWQW